MLRPYHIMPAKAGIHDFLARFQNECPYAPARFPLWRGGKADEAIQHASFPKNSPRNHPRAAST
jgi:hypothetical protein